MKYLLNDTIVGISTTLGKGAISIIRISGDDSITLVNKIFKGKDLEKQKSHTINYGHIYNYVTKEVIDEVLVSIFKKPKTYTVEDVVEINCHGGELVTQLILEEIVKLGARVANPGEFTKRAFLNGRIDLTKAEAVMDIIDAENKTALKIANQGLKGETKNKIFNLRKKLLDIISIIEVNIDYPEYDDVVELTQNEVMPIINEVLNEIDELLSDSKDAIKIKKGIDTALVGKPNVGKSSILNCLLQENRAIVTDIPGTTRDLIEAKLNMGSYVLNLIDTAGIRDTTDIIEQIGVQRSEQKINDADLILLVFDSSIPLSNEDLELLNKVKDKKHICIINKTDLETKIDVSNIDKPIYISTKDMNTIRILEQRIQQEIEINKINVNQNIYITNARQISRLNEASDSLKKAIAEINNEQYIDFIELFIKEAWISLGEILGDVKDTELLDELFSKFCLGK